jgi:hypothetical protein
VHKVSVRRANRAGMLNGGAIMNVRAGAVAIRTALLVVTSLGEAHSGYL